MDMNPLYIDINYLRQMIMFFLWRNGLTTTTRRRRRAALCYLKAVLLRSHGKYSQNCASSLPQSSFTVAIVTYGIVVYQSWYQFSTRHDHCYFKSIIIPAAGPPQLQDCQINHFVYQFKVIKRTFVDFGHHSLWWLKATTFF